MYLIYDVYDFPRSSIFTKKLFYVCRPIISQQHFELMYISFAKSVLSGHSGPSPKTELYSFPPKPSCTVLFLPQNPVVYELRPNWSSELHESCLLDIIYRRCTIRVRPQVDQYCLAMCYKLFANILKEYVFIPLLVV